MARLLNTEVRPSSPCSFICSTLLRYCFIRVFAQLENSNLLLDAVKRAIGVRSAACRGDKGD